jgi:hypothetical protein
VKDLGFIKASFEVAPFAELALIEEAANRLR